MTYEVPDCDVADSCFECLARCFCADYLSTLGFNELEINAHVNSGAEIYNNIYDIISCDNINILR